MKLLYIAGLSRSGSTLLDLLLGSHSGLVTVGELQILPHELRGDARIPCGCGRRVDACPFWADVVARCDPRAALAPQLDAFREHHGWGSTLRPARFGEFAGTPLPADRQRQIDRYGHNTAELVDAVADVTEQQTGMRPSVVVDASKDPYRALWLARSRELDVRVVHLVRDPRGSVHSLSNDRTNPLARDVVAFRRSVAWEVENDLIDRIRRNVLPTEQTVLIRYEDLVANPIHELQRALDLVGHHAEEAAVDQFQSLEVHTVAGNPMRRNRRPIRLDERWRTELAPSTRAIIDAVTRRRGRFGYD